MDNMDLFLGNGHLSDDGILSIINEKLNDLERLEASEHLSFCDDCLVRYTNMLDNAELYTPVEPILPPLKARMRQKLIKVVFSKYATAAAAVAIAVTLTVSGVFAPSNFYAIANAISINLPSPAQNEINVPQFDIPKNARYGVSSPAPAPAKVEKKGDEKVSKENPAIKASQKQNPLLQYLLPKQQSKK